MMPQPQQAPVTRAALYARVSTEEQAAEGHSIDAQLRALREFCTRKGWQISGEYVDAGASGRTLKRPKMQALLNDARATPRRFDVIVVHKLDRFSRSIADTIGALTQLKDIGIGLASATQPIDFTTPEGKAMLMMLAVFAEIYIDNLSKETAKGREERARKGFPNGHIPFGYRAVKKNPTNDAERAIEFDPANIEIYRLAIRMCADGKRVSEIMQALNARGFRSVTYRGARPFSKDMLFAMLKNRFYLGEVGYKGQWLAGRHEPAIDAATWERAQQQMERRAVQRRDHHTKTARAYVLRGLLFCAECGNRLCGRSSGDKIRYYRCPASDKGQACSQTRAVRADKLENQISEVLARVQLPADWRAHVLALMDAHGGDNRQWEKQRAKLKGELERLRVIFQLGDITEQAYRAERDRLRGALVELSPAQAFDVERAAQVLQNFGELWQAATLAEREEIARSMIERIFVFCGKITALEPKPDFYPLLAIAAQDADYIRVWDEDTEPFSPTLGAKSAPAQFSVLVIVPPIFFYQCRAKFLNGRGILFRQSNGETKRTESKRQTPRIERPRIRCAPAFAGRN